MMRCLTLVIAMLLPVWCGASERWAVAWSETMSACLSYLETGTRDVVDGWDVAFPGGGVCNGDPACETSVMVFIPVGRGAVGALEIDVADTVVGDNPRHPQCRVPFGLVYPLEAAQAALMPTLQARLRDGRLVRIQAAEVEAEQGGLVFRGCAYEGSIYVLRVAMNPPGPRFHAGIADHDNTCRGAVS